MKTKFIFIVFITTLLLYSCDKDTDGIGEDPKLNLENYSFSKDGGKIEIYSKKGESISINYDDLVDKKNENPQIPVIEYDRFVVSIDGGWYSAVVKYTDTVKITVSANPTGKTRYVPISIRGVNFIPKVSYTQEK